MSIQYKPPIALNERSLAPIEPYDLTARGSFSIVGLVDEERRMFRTFNITSEEFKRVGRLIVIGYGTIRIHKITRISRSTIRRIRTLIQEKTGKVFNCRCGRPANHKGCCIERMKDAVERHKTNSYEIKQAS